MGLEFAGKTFGGYRVGDVLDSGPHGALYAAEHTGSGDKVAIKIFAVDLSRDKNAAQRVVSEVQRASAVTHPNVVPVREVGTAEFKGKRHLFVAMDRLHGESLKSLIAKQKGQPLPLKQALHILSEVGAALEAIHRSNGVHRQLTSSAIFVAAGEAEPDESRIVVLDLGAALVPIGDDKKAKVGGKLQDDLRALAQLAYEMLAGDDASTEPGQALLPLRLRNRAVPARMDAVLRSVLGDALGTGDKGSRYDSAAAFVAALLGTGETQPIYASWSEDGRTFPAARKSHSTLLWAGLFAIAGGLALGYHLYSSEPTTQPGVNTPPKPPTPIVDQAGPVTPPTSSSAADAGADAGPARTPGPGHWPQRPGGKLPEVRAADAWPTPPATPSSTASPTPSPSPAAGASPAGVKDAAATGQPPPCRQADGSNGDGHPSRQRSVPRKADRHADRGLSHADRQSGRQAHRSGGGSRRQSGRSELDSCCQACCRADDRDCDTALARQADGGRDGSSLDDRARSQGTDPGIWCSGDAQRDPETCSPSGDNRLSAAPDRQAYGSRWRAHRKHRVSRSPGSQSRSGQHTDKHRPGCRAPCCSRDRDAWFDGSRDRRQASRRFVWRKPDRAQVLQRTRCFNRSSVCSKNPRNASKLDREFGSGGQASHELWWGERTTMR